MTASRLLNTMNVNIQKLYVDLMKRLPWGTMSCGAGRKRQADSEKKKGNTLISWHQPGFDGACQKRRKTAGSGDWTRRQENEKEVIGFSAERERINPCQSANRESGKTAVVEGLAAAHNIRAMFLRQSQRRELFSLDCVGYGGRFQVQR